MSPSLQKLSLPKYLWFGGSGDSGQVLVVRTELRHWTKGKTTSISVLVYTMLTSAA